jgi:hypothetical protein
MIVKQSPHLSVYPQQQQQQQQHSLLSQASRGRLEMKPKRDIHNTTKKRGKIINK